jgi:hypothetical protein
MINFCGDCGVTEGEMHEEGCDQERCCFCGKQKIQCDCGYDIKREPFFKSVFNCIRCGKIYPNLIMVSDKDWKEICGVTYKEDCILCKECMNFILNKRCEKNGICN